MTLEAIKIERWRKLMASDWTQVADAPLTTSQKNAWKTYRQSLRDLPESYVEGQEITWPVSPGEGQS